MKNQSSFLLLPAATAVLASLTCGVALAAPAPADIETLTVTGTRLPFDLDQLAAASTVIDQEEIRRSGALQITDLLRALPGITISQSGSPGALTEIRVRGSETNHLLVLIDGVVANDIGQGSAIDLAHLTADSIARIELLRGAQSALWGSGAIGGVLSITTKAGAGGQDNTSVTLGIGTDNTTQVALNATGSQDNVQFAAYADWQETAGDNIALTGDEDDGYRNITTGGSLNWAMSDQHAFSASTRLVDYTTDYDAIDNITTGLPVDAANVTDGKQLSGQLGWQFAPQNSDYTSQLQLQYRQDENNSSANGVFDGGTTGERYQVTWINRYALAGWQLAGGLEYLERQFEQRGLNLYGDPNQQQQDETVSLFGEAGKEVVSDVFATISARFDDNSEFDDAFSYRGGLTWQLDNTYSVYTSLGKAIKTPTFTERFGYYPETFIGNPALEPEQSLEWEVGGRASWNKTWSAEVNYFNARLEDEINGFVFDPVTYLSTASNKTGTSRREGLETQLNYHGDGVSVRATYSYTDASEEDIRELRRAYHQASVTVSADLPIEGLSAYTKLAYTGSRDDIFYPPYPAVSQRVGLQPYTLISANLAYAVNANLKVALRLDNALDESYQDIVGYSQSERRARLSTTYTF